MSCRVWGVEETEQFLPWGPPSYRTRQGQQSRSSGLRGLEEDESFEKLLGIRGGSSRLGVGAGPPSVGGRSQASLKATGLGS